MNKRNNYQITPPLTLGAGTGTQLLFSVFSSDRDGLLTATKKAFSGWLENMFSYVFMPASGSDIIIFTALLKTFNQYYKQTTLVLLLVVGYCYQAESPPDLSIAVLIPGICLKLYSDLKGMDRVSLTVPLRRFCRGSIFSGGVWRQWWELQSWEDMDIHNGE